MIVMAEMKKRDEGEEVKEKKEGLKCLGVVARDDVVTRTNFVRILEFSKLGNGNTRGSFSLYFPGLRIHTADPPPPNCHFIDICNAGFTVVKLESN